MRILPLLLVYTACTEEIDEKDTIDEEQNEPSEIDTENTEPPVEDTGVEPDDSDPSETEPEDTEPEETEPDDTEPEDTEPEDTAVVLQEGDWNVASPTLVSDSCELSNFQDVSEFVPAIIEVFNSSEASFNIDDTIVCEIDTSSFQCAAQIFTESVLLDSATMTIRNVMSGNIVNAELMDVTFDVTVESCDGIGCWAVESVLNFPCPVELTTSANY